MCFLGTRSPEHLYGRSAGSVLSCTLSSILHGLGYPGITFVLNLIACGIRILFVLFALPVYGIRGYLCGLLISQAVMALLSIGILLRQTHFNA